MARAPWRTTVAVEGKTLRTRLEQPNESAILEANRKAQSDSSRRGWHARIPEITREQWRRQGREDLLKGDRKALEKYVASPEGKQFSTMPRGRSRAFSRGGL